MNNKVSVRDINKTSSSYFYNVLFFVVIATVLCLVSIEAEPVIGLR